MNQLTIFLTAWAMAIHPAHGIETASIFTSGMLLQSDMPMPVWGIGKPNEAYR